MRRLYERGYLVFWRLGAFYCKKNTARGNLPGTALLWHSTPTREREKENRRERAKFSLALSIFLFF